MSQQKNLAFSLNFVDLFAGAGGLSCGLEMAGHRCLLGVDFDKHAMDTFALNHHHAQTFCGDICDLSEAKLKELTQDQPVHLVVGGPPCQGFSTVGLGNPKDRRNRLFLEFVRVVKVLAPEFVVVENVTGLLAKKNEKTLRAILAQFQALGYQLAVQVLAAHQYGVAEKRRRTVIIGSRINDKIVFPQPQEKVRTVGEVLSQLKAPTGEVFNHDLTEAKKIDGKDKKRLERIPEGAGIRYQADEKKFLTPSLYLGVNWKKLPENRFRQTKFQRLHRQRPAPTIMTHRHTYFHPTGDRYLTAREAAAIQSFPNDFVFKGPLSAQWRQIGNAVPPLLARAIGEAIADMYVQGKENLQGQELSLRPLWQTVTSMRKEAFIYRGKKEGKKDSTALETSGNN